MKYRFIFDLLKTSILPSFLIYLLVLTFSISAGIKPGLVIRDLMQTCNQPIGVGMISNLGILLWAFTSAICLFSTYSRTVKDKKLERLLFIGGLFSLLLCLDDLFLLHDRHISQDVLYSLYAILALTILMRFRGILSEINGGSLIIASLLLGLSIGSDIFQWLLPISYETVQFFEEGFKFIGIACWFTFWCQASIKAIKA